MLLLVQLEVIEFLFQERLVFRALIHLFYYLLLEELLTIQNHCKNHQ